MLSYDYKTELRFANKKRNSMGCLDSFFDPFGASNLPLVRWSTSLEFIIIYTGVCTHYIVAVNHGSAKVHVVFRGLYACAEWRVDNNSLIDKTRHIQRPDTVCGRSKNPIRSLPRVNAVHLKCCRGGVS
jgi:hypothetical protein